MSYCRIDDDCDVYAFCGGLFEIHVRGQEESYFMETLQEFHDKLFELKNKGHKVPQQTFDRINRELEEFK